MIRTALTTTCAFALMTGMAFAQAKTNGGATRGPTSPTSASSGVSQSTGQTQPVADGAYSTQNNVGLNSTSGSTTAGPGRMPNGPATNGDAGVMPASRSGSSTASMPQSSMPQSSMPASPTMIANTPSGEAPATYPRCTHKGQDRCTSMARR